MPSYYEYLMRHSEHGVLFVVEQVEHIDGIKYHTLPPLEERWDVLFGKGNNFPATPAMRLAA